MSANNGLTFFFLDLGSNYFNKNIDFMSKIIRLKDKHSYAPINFNIFTDIVYNVSNSSLKSITGTKDITQDSIINFYNNYFAVYLANNIYNRITEMNDVDVSMFNLTEFINESYPVCMFYTVKIKYVCIVNFNANMSKFLKLLNKKDNLTVNTSLHVIKLSNGIIPSYSNSDKHNGYNINLINAIWNSIASDSNLLVKEYTINKVKFKLSHLFTGIASKFYNLYIIFEPTSPRLDMHNRTFVNKFKSIKDKAKRAKKLNKVKDNLNTVLQTKHIKEMLETYDIDIINKSLSDLSISKTTDKPKNAKYFSPSTTTQITSNTSERVKELHSICKHVTGSKHCYYTGYNELLDDFDKFTINQANTNKLALGTTYDK